MKMGIRILAFATALATLVLSGCAHRISAYSPSYQNVTTLSKLAKQSHPINLGQFRDPKHTRSIMCRLEGSEALPNNETYIQYIHDGMKEDLENAKLYSTDSKTTLNASLDKVNFDSMMGNGQWTIMMTFNDHEQPPYTISSSYNFSTNFVADIACSEVAQQFLPAVQKFLGVVYRNPHFQKTLMNEW